MNPKQVQAEHAILPLFTERWSPYRFNGQPLDRQILLRCFEAARWTASSFNEQPWYFVVAERTNELEFQRCVNCLLEGNQRWARHAAVLLLAFSKESFTHNGTPNRVHAYDLGQAVASMVLQATAEGVYSHQMAGIYSSRIRQEYSVPDGYVPQTAIAMGYVASGNAGEDEVFRQRDEQPRQRKPLASFVFAGGWGKRFEG